jgi:hypothetical protein
VARPGAHPASGSGLKQNAVAVIFGLKHPSPTFRPVADRAGEHRDRRHINETRATVCWLSLRMRATSATVRYSSESVRATLGSVSDDGLSASGLVLPARFWSTRSGQKSAGASV